MESSVDLTKGMVQVSFQEFFKAVDIDRHDNLKQVLVLSNSFCGNRVGEFMLRWWDGQCSQSPVSGTWQKGMSFSPGVVLQVPRLKAVDEVHFLLGKNFVCVPVAYRTCIRARTSTFSQCLDIYWH